MPKGYPPSVFISSTCYDLSQVRLDLKRFVEGLGYEVLISEGSAFPVNPQITNIENCINAVRDRADIFVLIVGSRYGTTNLSGKSITNLEYLEARAKGVPIYVFVAKAVLNNLNVWRKNPSADFSGIVDSPDLFAFVNDLRGEPDLWMHEFDEVINITEILRKQWAILFSDSLIARSSLRSARLSAHLMSLPAESLKIILERPLLWEPKLLSSIIRSEVATLLTLKSDLKYGFRWQVKDELDLENGMEWLSQQLRQAIKLAQSCASLLNVAANEAMGPLGVPGNPELIVYVASRLGKIVKSMLEWKLEFLEVDVEEELSTLFVMLSTCCDDQIAKLEAIPDDLDREIVIAEAAMRRGAPAEINLNLAFDVGPGFPEVFKEIELIKKRHWKL